MTNTEIFVLVVGVYVLLCIVAYKVQEYFIFKPEKLSHDFEFRYDDPFEELFFEPEPGVKINALRFFHQSAKGLVIYFHGNTRSIKGWAKYAWDFSQHGYDVLMVDYRGFGKSVGKRSEDALKNDFQYIYKKMRSNYGYLEENIIIYGRSLGSGFACKLASQNKPKMLILDAPYYSFSYLMNRFLPFLPISIILRFRIRTDLWIRYVRCPIFIIHGTKDWLIPYRSSVRLSKLVPLTARLVPIYGGGHNNLPSFPEYHIKLGEILDGTYDLLFDKDIKPF
ncbi:MAG: alpha/beta fold hydrolase [Spirosomataceae bacterium]